MQDHDTQSQNYTMSRDEMKGYTYKITTNDIMQNHITHNTNDKHKSHKIRCAQYTVYQTSSIEENAVLQNKHFDKMSLKSNIFN